MIRRIVLLLGLAVLLLPAGVVRADEMPGDGISLPTSGEVEIEGWSLGLGIGFSWGSGTLRYLGREHRFTYRGLGLIDVGLVKETVTAEVENLENVTDFEGRYTAFEAGAALLAGKSILRMKNGQGVALKLGPSLRGIGFTLAPEGIWIDLE